MTARALRPLRFLNWMLKGYKALRSLRLYFWQLLSLRPLRFQKPRQTTKTTLFNQTSEKWKKKPPW